jgi:hypothetical protein
LSDAKKLIIACQGYDYMKALQPHERTILVLELQYSGAVSLTDSDVAVSELGGGEIAYETGSGVLSVYDTPELHVILQLESYHPKGGQELIKWYLAKAGKKALAFVHPWNILSLNQIRKHLCYEFVAHAFISEEDLAAYDTAIQSANQND